MKTQFKITKLFKLKFWLAYTELASIGALVLSVAWSPLFILLSVYFLIGVAALKQKINEETKFKILGSGVA